MQGASPDKSCRSESAWEPGSRLSCKQGLSGPTPKGQKNVPIPQTAADGRPVTVLTSPAIVHPHLGQAYQTALKISCELQLDMLSWSDAPPAPASARSPPATVHHQQRVQLPILPPITGSLHRRFHTMVPASPIVHGTNLILIEDCY